MLQSFVRPALFLGVFSFTLLASAQAVAALDSGGGPERVEITTEDRQVLAASLFAPRASKQLAPAALLLHGAGQERGDLAVLAKRLQKQGFFVLVPDLRGHGESVTADCDWSTASDDHKRSMWALAGRDVKACAEFLRERDGVHSTNLSLLGMGAGATLATSHAIRDENVRDLVLIEPILTEPESDQKSGFVLTVDSLEALGGLPTFVVISKQAEHNATRLTDAAMRAGGGGAFIEVEVSRCKSDEILSDRRLPAQTSKWMMDQASPKRGR